MISQIHEAQLERRYATHSFGIIADFLIIILSNSATNLKLTAVWINTKPLISELHFCFAVSEIVSLIILHRNNELHVLINKAISMSTNGNASKVFLEVVDDIKGKAGQSFSLNRSKHGLAVPVECLTADQDLQ